MGLSLLRVGFWRVSGGGSRCRFGGCWGGITTVGLYVDWVVKMKGDMLGQAPKGSQNIVLITSLV